jgi:hypothetical protein
MRTNNPRYHELEDGWNDDGYGGGGRGGGGGGGGGHLEFWLRQRGLGRFSDRLMDFGMESLHDLVDSDIISDVELRNEIGMNDAEIQKFRKAVHGNRRMDWSHLSKKGVDRVQRAARIMETQQHEGYAFFVLFVRKMKRSMHFKRVDKLGKLHNCSMRFTKSNQGVTFQRGGQKVALGFDASRLHPYIP